MSSRPFRLTLAAAFLTALLAQRRRRLGTRRAPARAT